jgi:hypothetical protein
MTTTTDGPSSAETAERDSDRARDESRADSQRMSPLAREAREDNATAQQPAVHKQSTAVTQSADDKQEAEERQEPEGHRQTAGDALPDDPLPKGMGWFSDRSGGLWAAVTTAFCVAVGGGAHLTLLSAGLGATESGHITHWWPMFWFALIGSSLVIGVIVWGLARQRAKDLKRNLWLGAVAAAATALSVAALFAVAWTSNNGHRVDWQPVVGTALALVALGSFGGYFLASRRARVGLAASFVLTFLLLFSFMLTLQVLDVAANGTAVAAGSKSASDVLGDFIKDFRGDVALIIGFYFGSDAAISVVKIFKSQGENDAELGRMDRDLAAPRPVSAPVVGSGTP